MVEASEVLVARIGQDRLDLAGGVDRDNDVRGGRQNIAKTLFGNDQVGSLTPINFLASAHNPFLRNSLLLATLFALVMRSGRPESPQNPSAGGGWSSRICTCQVEYAVFEIHKFPPTTTGAHWGQRSLTVLTSFRTNSARADRRRYADHLEVLRGDGIGHLVRALPDGQMHPEPVAANWFAATKAPSVWSSSAGITSRIRWPRGTVTEPPRRYWPSERTISCSRAAPIVTWLTTACRPPRLRPVFARPG